MEGAAEGAAHGGGVADEQQEGVGGGHDGLDALIDLVAHALGLVDDDEHVGAVETLELVCTVGGQPQRVAIGREFPSGVPHGASQLFRGWPVEPVNLPPEDVAHLAEGGRGGQDDGLLWVGVHEPEYGDGGAEALAQAVARLDGDAPAGGEGFQDLLLLVPQVHSEHVAGEGHGRLRRPRGVSVCTRVPCRV